jgi:hypothetical protein
VFLKSSENLAVRNVGTCFAEIKRFFCVTHVFLYICRNTNFGQYRLSTVYFLGDFNETCRLLFVHARPSTLCAPSFVEKYTKIKKRCFAKTPKESSRIDHFLSNCQHISPIKHPVEIWEYIFNPLMIECAHNDLTFVTKIRMQTNFGHFTTP